MCCSLDSCTVARVRLGGGVGFGGCVPVAENMSASCRMASMVWAPKQENSAAGAGFARASSRCLDVSVAALAKETAGMAPLWGKSAVALVVKWGCAYVPTVLAMEVPHMPLLQGLVDE